MNNHCPRAFLVLAPSSPVLRYRRAASEIPSSASFQINKKKTEDKFKKSNFLQFLENFKPFFRIKNRYESFDNWNHRELKNKDEQLQNGSRNRARIVWSQLWAEICTVDLLQKKRRRHFWSRYVHPQKDDFEIEPFSFNTFTLKFLAIFQLIFSI